jgi:hypothetical protein
LTPQTSDLSLAKDNQGLTPHDRVAALLGVPEAKRHVLGSMLGVGDSANWGDIVQALRARGETDLADLVTSPTFVRD